MTMRKVQPLGKDDQKLIDEAIDHGCKLPFDVCDENGNKLTLYNIVERPHTIKGFSNFCCLYACRDDREIIPENFIPYDGEVGANWGLTYVSAPRFRNHHYEEFRQSSYTTITRNDEPFCIVVGDAKISILKALTMIETDIPESPFNLNFKEYQKYIIGRQVYYRSEPGIIESYVAGSAEVYVKAETPTGKFTIPAEWGYSPELDHDRDTVRVSIFDENLKIRTR